MRVRWGAMMLLAIGCGQVDQTGEGEATAEPAAAASPGGQSTTGNAPATGIMTAAVTLTPCAAPCAANAITLDAQGAVGGRVLLAYDAGRGVVSGVKVIAGVAGVATQALQLRSVNAAGAATLVPIGSGALNVHAGSKLTLPASIPVTASAQLQWQTLTGAQAGQPDMGKTSLPACQDAPRFWAFVRPLLEKNCVGCHAQPAHAARTRLDLVGLASRPSNAETYYCRQVRGLAAQNVVPAQFLPTSPATHFKLDANTWFLSQGSWDLWMRYEFM